MQSPTLCNGMVQVDIAEWLPGLYLTDVVYLSFT